MVILHLDTNSTNLLVEAFKYNSKNLNSLCKNRKEDKLDIYKHLPSLICYTHVFKCWFPICNEQVLVSKPGRHHKSTLHGWSRKIIYKKCIFTSVVITFLWANNALSSQSPLKNQSNEKNYLNIYIYQYIVLLEWKKSFFQTNNLLKGSQCLNVHLD